MLFQRRGDAYALGINTDCSVRTFEKVKDVFEKTSTLWFEKFPVVPGKGVDQKSDVDAA